MAEQRHHQAETEPPVKIRSADPHAVVGQNIVLPIRLAVPLRAETNDREVGCSAADVGDQRDFLARDLAFVVEGRRNRLKLERNVVKADAANDLAQGRFGLPVASGELSTKCTGRP